MKGFINDLEAEKNSIVCQLQMQLIRCWTDNRNKVRKGPITVILLKQSKK